MSKFRTRLRRQTELGNLEGTRYQLSSRKFSTGVTLMIARLTRLISVRANGELVMSEMAVLVGTETRMLDE